MDTVQAVFRCVVALAAVLVITCKDAGTDPTGGTEPKPGNSITVLAPNGGERFHTGDTVHVKWRADTDHANDVVIACIIDDGTESISITTDFSVYYEDPEWGDFIWVIPNDIIPHDTVGSIHGWIRIHDYMETRYEDSAEGPFTISRR